MPDFVDVGDFMTSSATLRAHGRSRSSFDPTNAAHLASLKKFLETGGWGNVQFFPEFPFNDVPTYVLTKFACHHLNAHRQSLAEQAVAAAGNRGPLTDITTANLVKGEALKGTGESQLKEVLRHVTDTLTKNEDA